MRALIDRFHCCPFQPLPNIELLTSEEVRWELGRGRDLRANIIYVCIWLGTVL